MENDLQRAYLLMVEWSNKDSECATSFYCLSSALGIDQREAIELVNSLVALGKIEFVGALEQLWNGDYLCRYEVGKW